MQSRDLASLAREAMRERGLEPDFPPSAIAQTQRLRAPDIDHLPEQRHLPWCSIDNDDSHDLIN
jgi:exoribonuclease II